MKPEVTVETAILGMLLMFPRDIPKWIGVIDVDDFSEPLNRSIWGVIVDNTVSGRPVDLIIVDDALGGGHYDYLTKSVSESYAYNMGEYVRILKQDSYLRKITKAVRVGLDLGEKPEDIANTIANLPQYSEKPEYTMVDLIEMVKEVASHNKGTEFKYNLSVIQDMTGGLDRGELLMIGGHTSMGKTSLAIHLSIGFAEAHHKILYCTAEMSDIEIARRQLANKCHINIKNFREGSYTKSDDDKVSLAVSDIKEWNYDIKKVNTTLDIRSAMSKHNPDIVIVDHLQNLSGKGKNKFEIVTENISQLQSLGFLNNVGMIVLSQLHRGEQTKTIPRPRLRDFRASGEIEEKATQAILCHWQAKAEDKVSRIHNQQEIYEVNIAKNRDGKTGYCKIGFFPEYSLFEQYIDIDNPSEVKDFKGDMQNVEGFDRFPKR